MKNIPSRGRTYEGVLGAAGGSQNDLYGVSFSSSTSVENSYVADGVNTTGVRFGGVQSPVLNNFIQEIEVITGGHNAELGRSTGACTFAPLSSPIPARRCSMIGNHIPIILATTVAFGCSDSATQSEGALQASAASQVVHRVTAGSPDLCEAIGLQPGCDANFSLVALERADGSVTGEWHDQFSPIPDFGGLGIHVAVDCLLIIGNQAWVSGVITQSRFSPIVGVDVVTTVVDNGRSANDPADEISFSTIGTGIDCNAAPEAGLPVFPVPQGQVVVN